MYCTQCGVLIAADAQFCPKCSTSVSPANPKASTATGSVASAVTKPRVVWLYVVSVLLVGTYAAMFLPAFAGQAVNPQTGPGSMLWTGLFFYLWWRRRARKGWHGALIGVAIGILAFGIAAFIGGYVRSAAGH